LDGFINSFKVGKFMIITQGFQLKYEVPTSDSQFIMKNDSSKVVIAATAEDGHFYIIVEGTITKDWVPGLYKYQIINSTGIIEDAQITVLVNFLYLEDSDSVKTHNEIILEAIEAQLEGRATSNQASMSVGDKSISYCSLNELLNLREYFKAKVDIEKGKKPDILGKTLKYTWNLR